MQVKTLFGYPYQTETMTTNKRLRELLKTVGLPTTGNKQQLRERIADSAPFPRLHPTQQSLWNHCFNITAHNRRLTPYATSNPSPDSAGLKETN